MQGNAHGKAFLLSPIFSEQLSFLGKRITWSFLTLVRPIYFIVLVTSAVRHCAKTPWLKWIPVPLSAALLFAGKTGQGTRVRVSVAVVPPAPSPSAGGEHPAPQRFSGVLPTPGTGRAPSWAQQPAVPSSGVSTAFCPGARWWKMHGWSLGRAASSQAGPMQLIGM